MRETILSPQKRKVNDTPCIRHRMYEQRIQYEITNTIVQPLSSGTALRYQT